MDSVMPHATPLRRQERAGSKGPGAEKNLLLWGISGLLALAVGAVYWPVVGHQFVNFDDVGYIIQNPHAQAGLNWDGIKWAFTSGYAANWHPLTWLSHMLDCQLFGLRAG